MFQLFVLSLESNESLLIALLYVSEFIKFITDDDSLLSRSLSIIFFVFAVTSSNLRFW